MILSSVSLPLYESLELSTNLMNGTAPTHHLYPGKCLQKIQYLPTTSVKLFDKKDVPLTAPFAVVLEIRPVTASQNKSTH